MVLTIHGGGTLQSSSQMISVPPSIRKKALNLGIKFECTHAWVIGKSGVQFGIPLFCLNTSVYNLEYPAASQLFRECLLLFAKIFWCLIKWFPNYFVYQYSYFPQSFAILELKCSTYVAFNFFWFVIISFLPYNLKTKTTINAKFWSFGIFFCWNNHLFFVT